MKPTIIELQRYYDRLSDEQIKRIASYEVNGLTPEALQVLRHELQKRSLLKEFEHAIELQQKGPTDEDIESLLERITTLACPHCGDSRGHLNAFDIMSVKSILIIDLYRRGLLIGCNQCIKQAAKNALVTTLILGWWSPPGLFRTIQAIIKNIKALTVRPDQRPTEELLDYVKKNAGAIAVRMDDKNALRNLLLGTE